DPAHAGLDDRDVDAEALTDRRVNAHGLGTSFSPSPSGSITSRIQRSSSSLGSRVVVGPSAGRASAKPVAATTSTTVTPGGSDRSCIVWSGVSKSHTQRLVTTRTIS